MNYHYDHPVGFWKVWLDESLCYSCAYFDSPETTLADAQKNKLDYICRKLRLRPGQRLLDMGCGWGALMLHAAKNYGVSALGLTLSPEQAEIARERVRAAGLERQCRVEVDNFLEFRPREPSIGLSASARPNTSRKNISKAISNEHLPCFVPEDNFFITRSSVHRLSHRVEAVRSCSATFSPIIFSRPSAERSAALQRQAFEPRDVESLREHYKMTLEHWLARFEHAQNEIERQTDNLSFRVFRLYLAGSAYEFRRGRLNIYQTLLVKPADGETGLPLTRADWYSAGSGLSQQLEHGHRKIRRVSLSRLSGR